MTTELKSTLGNDSENGSRTDSQTLSAFLHPRVITMLFFGFSAGIPILLIFSSLSLWLREAGVERSVVTLFSWAALGYSFKFVWAPLVDSLPLPVLSRLLGRRRSWILFSQLMIILAIVLMASSDPVEAEGNLFFLALAAVMLGFSSATQDIVIDAYRIESADVSLQAMMSSTYIAGYRIGMLVAGAGALYLASAFGSTAEHYSYIAWKNTYLIMAAVMLVGVITTLVIPEPESKRGNSEVKGSDNFQAIVLFVFCVSGFILAYFFTSEITVSLKSSLSELMGNRALSSMIIELLRLILAIGVAYLVSVILMRFRIISSAVVSRLYFEPVRDFFERYGTGFAVLLICLIGCYRISDIVLGVISNVFYQDMGFSKNEIATASKLFGLWMTLLGGFLGGVLSMKMGVVRILLIGAVLASATNVLFIMLAQSGYNIPYLYAVIGIDSLSAGIASAAFVAFLSALTNIKFSAMQYAIFSSMMTLIPKVLGGYSGGMVDTIGYSQFFMFTTLLGVPVIVLVVLVSRKMEV
jgi:PAT family beta-lactamase induction signal transducer AmpG